MVIRNFIEVTNFDDGANVLVPIDKILSIVCDSGGNVFVEMGTDNGTVSSGILVIESYDEIKNKLKQREA